MDLKGICLKAINYKEKDKILVIASLQKGIITAKAASVRSAKAKLKAGCMPMVFGEFSLAQGKGGYILKGIDIEENFHNCWTDTSKNLAAMLILETLEKICVKGEDITREILLALKALKAINYESIYPYAIVVWFLLKILKYIGVDYTVEEIPQGAKDVLDELADINIEDIEALDLLTLSINRAIVYLDLIIKNQLSTNLKIINEIVKLTTKLK